MSLKPKNTVEDSYVEGLTCALCDSPDLHVVHLEKYPDYVSCGSCGSAFVVEDEGSWIMYGKFNAELPQTREFALRQWTWLDAVRQRAEDERLSLSQEPAEPPQPPMTDLPIPALEEKPAEAELETEAEVSEVSPPPPSKVEEMAEPTAPSVFPEAKEFTSPEDIPLDTDRVEDMAPEGATPPDQFDELQQSRLEQVTAPTGETSPQQPVEEQVVDEQLVEDKPGEPPSSFEATLEDASLPVPDWLEQKPAEGAEEILSTAPFTEDTSDEAQTKKEAIVPPFVGDIPDAFPPATEAGVPGEPEAEPSASKEATDFLDLLRESDEAPTFTLPKEMEASAFPGLEDTSPEIDQELTGLEEVDEPIEEHLLPPWARGEVTDEVKPPVEEFEETPVPSFLEEAPEEKFIPEEPFPFSLEKTAAVDTQAEVSKPEPVPSVMDAPPPEEPEEGYRHRVVVKGDRLTFPKNVCSHCLRTPVSLATAVRGTLPDPTMPALRKPLTFKLPLCHDCERRAKASTQEERSARIQAHVISGIVAVFLMLLALVFKLARFDPNAFEGILVLLIVGVLGYGIPAILLLNRASNYPPPFDAAYVLTTLRVLDDAGEGNTAFEWRNQGYAELFRQVNRQNAKGTVSKVEDTMMIAEPEQEQEPEPETGTEPSEIMEPPQSMEQAFEDMIAEAQVSDSEMEIEIPPGTEEGGKLDTLEQVFRDTSPPDKNPPETE
jgi:hypothetical protein